MRQHDETPFLHFLGQEMGLNTWRKPLNGARPVPGPTIMIGVEGSDGSLKFDCLTKMGAQLQFSFTSEYGSEF